MTDNCCHLCKGPHGICLSRYQCQHHQEADAQDEANNRARRTYNNPTQDRAIANVMRARNPKRRAKYKEDQ